MGRETAAFVSEDWIGRNEPLPVVKNEIPLKQMRSTIFKAEHNTV